MKKWMLVVLVLAGSVSWGQAQIKIGNRTINTKKVLNAASEVASAITLSDEDVAALCRESVKWMDEQNPVSDPGSAYSKRLDSLMKKVGEIEGGGYQCVCLRRREYSGIFGLDGPDG